MRMESDEVATIATKTTTANACKPSEASNERGLISRSGGRRRARWGTRCMARIGGFTSAEAVGRLLVSAAKR